MMNYYGRNMGMMCRCTLSVMATDHIARPLP